jgi:hypothetical protein
MDTIGMHVDRIYFLVHPLCYEPHADEPEFVAKCRDYIEYEAIIKSRWYERMARMEHGEVLVVCGGPAEFLDDVANRLGESAVIVRDTITHEPELWDSLLSNEAKEELGRDLLAMYWKHEFEWQSNPLGQPVIARGWAERVRKVFKERRFTFDPATVQAEGWGESFEGCVANYTRFLGTYLKLANPIEDMFEMTVPDAGFLLRATLREVIPLTNSLRLYLWEGEDGRLIGWFHKALATIGEPSVFVRLGIGSIKTEIHSRKAIIWPARESVVEWNDGHLTVPVRGAHYVIARDTTFERFRDVLANAEQVEGYGQEQSAI